MADKSNGFRLWEIVFNTDLEEASLERADLKKNFEDMGTPEEMADIVAYLEDKDKMFILSEYLYYNGHGIDADTIRYLIRDLLQIDDINELRECE